MLNAEAEVYLLAIINVHKHQLYLKNKNKKYLKT